MDSSLTRRTLLRGCAVAAGAAATSGLVGPSAAQPAMAAIEVPDYQGPGRPLQPGRGNHSVFVPRADWHDTDGNLIEAHAGSMFVENETYHWVGANWMGTYEFRAFNLNASTDLQNWDLVKKLLEPSPSSPQPARSRGPTSCTTRSPIAA